MTAFLREFGGANKTYAEFDGAHVETRKAGAWDVLCQCSARGANSN